MANLPINKIIVEERKREVKYVDDLARSIAVLGLLNPITVVMQRQNIGGLDSHDAPVLVAGQRRLKACKSLKWTEIPATIVELYDLDVELAEIDENLIRKNLTALEKAEQLERRKWIYEQKYPETKAGVAGADAKHGRATENVSFAEDTAKSTGYTERSIQYDVAIADGIPLDLRDKLRGTAQADSQEDLKALARRKNAPDVQRKAVKAVISGEAANLRKALKTEPRITESLQSMAIGSLAEYLTAIGADPDHMKLICRPLLKKNPVLGKIFRRIKRAA